MNIHVSNLSCNVTTEDLQGSYPARSGSRLIETSNDIYFVQTLN